MQFKLGGVDFDVRKVTAGERAAIINDPIIQQVVSRDVYRWDHKAGTGETLVELTPKDAVPMPNCVSFFVPRIISGEVSKNDSASKTLAKRTLKAVGARSPTDILVALHKALHMPQKSIEHSAFAPFNGCASYTLRMETEFHVAHLVNAPRNLAVHVLIPGQVRFVQTVTDRDEAAFGALLAADPALAAPNATFVIPPHSRANLMVRAIAVSRRLEDLQADLAARKEAGEEVEGTDLHRAFNTTMGEFRMLRQRAAA